jgi:copper chaperone
MNCGGCARSVTKAIESVDPSAVVTTDVAARKVDVTSTAPREKLAIALTDIGYAPA